MSPAARYWFTVSAPPAIAISRLIEDKKLATHLSIVVTDYVAHEAWVDAHEEFENVAPAVDQKALEDAIRAGKRASIAEEDRGPRMETANTP